MNKLRDYVLEWTPASRRIDAKCRVQIFEANEGPRNLIILTELPDNPGMSVTNGLEIIATIVLMKEGLMAHSCQWIEHYIRPNMANFNHGLCPHPKGQKEEMDTFNPVVFTTIRHQSVSGPNWEDVKWPQIAQRIGTDKEWFDL